MITTAIIINITCNLIAIAGFSFYLLNQDGRITKFFKR